MKRIVALLLCLVLAFALVACGEGEPAELGTDTVSDEAEGLFTDSDSEPSSDTETASDPVSETKTDSGTDTKTDTSTNSGSSGGTQNSDAVLYDPTIEHKFIATDITNHSIVVFDLNLCEGDFQLLKEDDVAVIWEWDADEDPNCTGNVGAGIDSAKYRYSEYYKRDVIIACSSSGWAGVIDYEAKSLLWEYQVGNGPHSIEMLPNGDVVVACSSDPGALAYVPLSAGATRPVSSIDSLYCHGVSWDPENEWLWVLEDDGVYAATIKNMGTMEGKIQRVNGLKFAFANGETGGHAFSPVGGEPGKYWASSGKYLWQFDSVEETLTRSYARSSTLTAKTNIKGIASFADGTVVQTVSQMGGKGATTYDWSCDGFRIITREMSTGKVPTPKDVVTIVQFENSHREFYKVQPFTKEYQ